MSTSRTVNISTTAAFPLLCMHSSKKIPTALIAVVFFKTLNISEQTGEVNE